MSILDGLPKTEEEMTAIISNTAHVFGKIIEEGEAAGTVSPKMRSIIDALSEGLSLADIFKITKAERAALLVQGCRQMQVGDHAGARATLTMLHHLEPTDALPIYALGGAYQGLGDFATAAKVYVQFLALDATNPEGYLRLGECLLAAGELADARSCFETARAEAGKRKPRPDLVAYADRMLALVAGRSATAA